MADEKEKIQDEKKESEKTEEKKPVGNKPIMAGIIAGVVIINAIVAFVFIQLLKPPNPEEVEAKMKADSLKQTVATQTTIGAISDPPIEAIVNIAGTDGMRFLKVVMVFEYDDKKHKKLGDELIRREAKLRDLLIKQLSVMTLEELNDAEAQTQIQKDFMRTVNNTLPSKIGQISTVYIKEFIIQ